MVVWSANGNSSKQQDLYSTGRRTPNVDSFNGYTTTFKKDSTTGEIVFTTHRDLDTGLTNNFVIPLDEPLNLSYAFTNGQSGLSYHSSRKGFFTLTLSKDGVVQGDVNEDVIYQEDPSI